MKRDIIGEYWGKAIEERETSLRI